MHWGNESQRLAGTVQGLGTHLVQIVLRRGIAAEPAFWSAT